MVLIWDKGSTRNGENEMFEVGQKVRDNQGQEGRVTDVDVCEGKASYTVRIGKYELVRFPDELEAS